MERVGKSRIIRDIALWIDERIPRSYYKWKHKNSDLNPANIGSVNADELGLGYHFDENSSVVHK